MVNFVASVTDSLPVVDENVNVRYDLLYPLLSGALLRFVLLFVLHWPVTILSLVAMHCFAVINTAGLLMTSYVVD